MGPSDKYGPLLGPASNPKLTPALALPTRGSDLTPWTLLLFLPKEGDLLGPVKVPANAELSWSLAAS